MGDNFQARQEYQARQHEHEQRLAATLLHTTQALAAMHAAVARSNEGSALKGAEVRPLAGPIVSSQVVSFSAGRLVGFALLETAGAVARINIRDGDLTGPILMPIALAASESTREVWSQALSFNRGLYFELVSGTVIGALYTGAVD
jgi:hypothetical protein